MTTIQEPLADSDIRPFATTSAFEQRVADHPFCHSLSRRLVHLLTECAMRVHFDPGQMIFREGDLANRFYLIERGAVALESTEPDADPVPIQNIGAGDVLGWSWLFPPYYCRFDARALEATDAIFFYGTRLREVCEEDRELGYELLKRMSMILLKRLQGWTQKLSKGIPVGAESVSSPRPYRADWSYDKSKTLDEMIAGHPFFKTINPAYLPAITSTADEKVFEHGELIIKSKEYANQFFILEEGKVALEYTIPNNGSVPIQIVTAADVFGWSWLFPPFTWHFQARALERTKAAVLNGAKLLILCETNHGLGYELVRRVAQVAIERLQATRKQVLLHQRSGRAEHSLA